MSHLCLLGVATLTLTCAGFAGSDTNADLQARLEAAEARISELSAASNTKNWLNETRANEFRGLVHDVLADADTRASLQGSGATAGYNGGFTIGSADGNWSMTINGVLQTRWIHNEVDNRLGPDGVTQQEDNQGFEQTRALLNFSGSIAGDYGYNIRIDWGAQNQLVPSGTTGIFNNNNVSGVEWAYGTMDLGDGWELAAGRMKLPTNREWMINAENQLGIERSYTSQATLADDGDPSGTTAAGGTGNDWATTGISFNYSDDDMRFWAMYGNGLQDAPFTVYTANDNSHVWGLRFEYMVDGSGWSQFDQFTSPDGGEAGTLVGVSWMNNDWGDFQGGAPVAGVDSNNMLTVDAQLQFGGSNLYVAYSSNDIDIAAGTSFDPSSLEIQYGIYLNDEWELYARYQDIDWDTNNVSNNDALTIGMNYYLAGQNAKWSTDISWADDGWNADAETNWANSQIPNDQTMVRTQLQLSF